MVSSEVQLVTRKASDAFRGVGTPDRLVVLFVLLGGPMTHLQIAQEVGRGRDFTHGLTVLKGCGLIRRIGYSFKDTAWELTEAGMELIKACEAIAPLL